MIRLYLLGPLDLRDSQSTELRSVLSQPKRTAVLAYLAAGKPGLHQRGTLLPLFWPELDETHARNSLSKSLHHLKRSFGDDVIVTRGADEIGISPDHLWCDVVAFRAALDAGDREGALSLYGRGPLLDGFSVADSPAFEEWLGYERGQLERRAVEAAGELADAAERADDLRAALHWSRRAAGLARYDESVFCRLLTLLDRTGDRAGAVAAYGEFAERLQQELELEPSPETNAQVALIRARVNPPATAHAASSVALPLPEFGARSALPRLMGTAISTRVGRRKWSWITGWIAAAVFVVVSIGSVVRSRPLEEASFDVTPGEGRSLLQGVSGVEFALSPDGSRIVYVGESPQGGPQLWQRSLDDLESAPIPGTAGALAPAFSPDGASVAFQAMAGIRTISLKGGPALTVTSAGAEPAIGADRSVYFARNSILYRVPATGGEAQALTQRTDGEQAFPEVLPDGRGLLLTIRRVPVDRSGIAVMPPAGGAVKEIFAGTMARYAATGHIVYVTANGTLMAAPFDLKRLAVTGPAVALRDGIQVKIGSASQFAISESGMLLYKTGEVGLQELVWVSRGGGVEPVDPSWTGFFRSPALSPDGKRVAVALSQGMRERSDIWIKRLDRGPNLRLTFDGSANSAPAWTPDGKSVTFLSDRAGGEARDLWTQKADGSDHPALQLRPGFGGNAVQWSPDGSWLVYHVGYVNGNILASRPEQGAAPVPLAADTAISERMPALSSNGRWLAFTSNETRREEVWVVPFPNALDAKWQVSTDGGGEPVWSPDGTELFYRNARREMVAVSVTTEPAFEIGSARVLFSTMPFQADRLHAQYDVTSDGSRFLMVRRARGEAAGQLILRQNFFEELRRATR